MRLDITAMEEDRQAIRAVKVPVESVYSFRKGGDRGPFTIMLDLNKILAYAPTVDYLQITADFNDPDNVIIGQRGGKSGSIVPIRHLTGPDRSYSYSLAPLEEYDIREQEQRPVDELPEEGPTPREEVTDGSEI